jgi:hypothetical protein
MRFPALLALAVAPVALAANVSAQELPPEIAAPATAAPQNTITFNPVALVFGAISLEYERAVADSVSVFVSPKVLAFNAYGLDDGTSIFAAGASVGARIFLSGTAPEGTWLSPTVGVAYVNIDVGEEEATVVGYEGEVLFGHTWIWNSGFALSLGIGGGYADYSAESTNPDDDEIGLRGFTVAGRASIGWAF